MSHLERLLTTEVLPRNTGGGTAVLNKEKNGGNFVQRWAIMNKETIIETAAKWRMTPQELILTMLNDALETYSKIELKDDAWN